MADQSSPAGGRAERAGTRGERRTRGGRRGTARKLRQPVNIFFARIDGRVAALLIGRGGQLRVQRDRNQRWTAHQVAGVTRRLAPWRLDVAVDGGEDLELSVYGSDEVTESDLGGTRRGRAVRAFRSRRQAALRLRALLER